MGVTRVASRAADNTVMLTGTVQAQNEINLSFRIDGRLVEDLEAREAGEFGGLGFALLGGDQQPLGALDRLDRMHHRADAFR